MSVRRLTGFFLALIEGLYPFGDGLQVRRREMRRIESLRDA